MKKLIVCLIMVCVIFSMTACGSEEKEVVTNPSETTVTSTETSDEVNVTESPNTEKVENTETTVTEPTTQESTSNKNEGNTNSNSNSGNGTSNKPSKPNTNENTESQKPSSKPSSGGNTTVKPTTPATKPAETKPYFVSLEYVSETRPNTFYVDGMDVLTRVYGQTHYAYQTGDTVTYRVNMSDGGNKGFEIESTFGCNAKISGNKIIVTINGRANSASVKVRVQTKNGYENKCICDLRVYKATENLDYHRDALAIIYGENIGMEWVNGYTNHESGIFERVAPNEMFNTMDKLKNMGCTKFDCSAYDKEFQIIAGN